MPFKMSVSLAVPNLFGTGDKFCGRHFFHGLGVGINFGMILVRDIYCTLCFYLGFPDSSVGKESACNPGDPGSIPGSGRSAGEVIGDPLQYSCAFLVAQMVKNPPAMRETWVQSLGWEDTLEEGMATHSSTLAWRTHRQRSLAGCSPYFHRE